jgi:GMP synthase-like glutamine amidotransferase
MRAHYLQHVGFEGIGHIDTWLAASGCAVSCTRFFEDPALPAPDAFDLLVIMGGPMSVNDEVEYPWLAAEKRFIRATIEAGKAVLGICLGAQLIASALGSRVYRNPLPEIGWFPVAGSEGGQDNWRFPVSLQAYHWHGETFDLPAGAVLLASSQVCRHQAFQLGRRVVGLQCHLESTPTTVAELVEHCYGERQAGSFVQSADAMLTVPAGRYSAMHRVLDELLGYLTSGQQK